MKCLFLETVDLPFAMENMKPKQIQGFKFTDVNHIEKESCLDTCFYHLF